MQEIDSIINGFLKELDCDLLINMSSRIKTGKKLRSKLILSIAKANEDSLKLCAVVELIHLASLLHDDIIDEAKLRRGARSINDEFGAKNALMLGDILYAKAFSKLVSFNQNISYLISNSVAQLAIGELLDVNLSQKFNKDKNLYLDMLYKKTASLIEASAASAAVLEGLNEDDFKEYGRCLGIAFQLVDDILDITSDEDRLGKPSMSDFKEGKSTVAYIYLYECLDEKDKEKMLTFFKKDLNEDEKQWFFDKFAKYDIISKAKKEAFSYGERALKAIDKYKNEKLIQIVENMIDRSF